MLMLCVLLYKPGWPGRKTLLRRWNIERTPSHTDPRLITGTAQLSKMVLKYLREQNKVLLAMTIVFPVFYMIGFGST